MYENILVPTDGSEGTDAAIEHAIDLAETYGAALHTMYVVDVPTNDSRMIDVYGALEDEGEQAIQDVIDRAQAAGVETVEGAVGEGVVHRVILQYVEDHDVDMVVMGTHGRTGIDRYLLGSVAEKVVRLSEAPVLTVRLTED